MANMQRFRRIIAERKQSWMRDYERLLVEKHPYMAGRVDWDTATYLYNQDMSPKQAADITTVPPATK